MRVMSRFFVSTSPYGAMLWTIIESEGALSNEHFVPAQDGSRVWVSSHYFHTTAEAERAVADNVKLEWEIASANDGVEVIRL